MREENSAVEICRQAIENLSGSPSDQPIEQEKNPDYREHLSDADVDTLFDKYG